MVWRMTILICFHVSCERFHNFPIPEPPEDKACLVLGDFVSSVLICKQFLKIFGAPRTSTVFSSKQKKCTWKLSCSKISLLVFGKNLSEGDVERRAKTPCPAKGCPARHL